jgi:hypothetical protein
MKVQGKKEKKEIAMFSKELVKEETSYKKEFSFHTSVIIHHNHTHAHLDLII